MAAHARRVEEVPAPGPVPLWRHPDWQTRFPWLAQGTTGRGPEGDFDLGLAGAQAVGPAMDRWRALLAVTEMETVVHARQVHGADLWIHRERGAPGIVVMAGFDGHVTDRTGLLLAVGVADCIPVSVVDPVRCAVAMVHAGWRGVAAGIVERAVRRLLDSWASPVHELWLHCGPSICGRCYEVGPEVHAGVNPGRPVPGGPTCIDLRASVVERVVGLGMDPDHVSVSAHCTRCGPGTFFSHRAGSPARQMGVLGIRG
jgi:YfiH family protein